MPSEASNIQAVFLIDASLCRNGGTKWDEAISLGIFRLLSFLKCQLQVVNKTKTKSLRWGYKLFDIDEKIGRLDSRSAFNDFKLKTFQDFEKNLKICFQHVTEADKQPVADVTVGGEQQQEQKKKGFLLQSHPSLCLSRRLTETVHDFPWEMPDVASPVKGKKSHGRFESAEPSNFVFLISRVPCDKKSLRHYCNKVVMDKNVFLDSFMPPLLLKQFCDDRKIQLHWIDVGRYQMGNEATGTAMAADMKSYGIVKRSLKMVRGLLIPLHSLVTSLTSTTGEVADGETSRRDHMAILLTSFACMSVCSALMPCWRGKKSGSSGQTLAQTSTTSATLIFEDLDEAGGGSRNVSLKLVPIIRKVSKRQQASIPQQIEVKSSDNSDGACILVTQASSVSHHSRAATPTHLRMRACMDKSHVRQLGGNLGQHFLCFIGASATTEQQGALSSLLQTLHSHQQALILSVTLDKETCPYLAVLEGSSTSTAHLTYLSLGVTLQVEKQLTLQPAAPRGKSQEYSQGISLEGFKSTAANAISAHASQKEQGEEQDVAEAVSSSGDDGRGGLWTGVLNSWHVAGSVPQIQSALNSLTDRLQENSDLSKAKRRVLGDLKQAYRRENQPPFLLNPFQQSTPVFLPTASTFLTADSIDRSNSSWESLSTSEGRKSVKHESILTRGRLMVIKARSMSTSSQGLDEIDGDFVPRAKPDVVPQLYINQADVKTTEDLSQFVQQEYGRALETDTDLQSIVRTIVPFTLHFMAKHQSSCPQRNTSKFLEEKILKPHQELRAALPKSAPEGEDSSERTKRLKELKLQALFRLEIESLYSDVDQIDQTEREESREQIVELLRSLLFGLGPKPALEFLNTVVLHNYQSTLHEFLVNLYDELMQPLPRGLRRHDTPEKDMEPPLSDSSSSTLAIDDVALSMASNEASLSIASSDRSAGSPKRRTRSSVLSHPSLPSISNKRQIEVKAPPAKKESKGKKGSKGKSKMEKSKSPAKQKGGKKTRRNLFDTDLCNAPSKKDDAQASRSSQKRHPSSSEKHKGRQETFVAETPRHRQSGRLSRQREQDDENQASGSNLPEVVVIQESPFKDIQANKTTPGRYKAPRRVLRSSFYSAGSSQSSRSVSRAMENPDNISGRHHVSHLRASRSGQLAEALSMEGVLSPRRQVTALLNPQPSMGASPELRSPAFNTRSRTPKRSSSHKSLFHDSRSMPAFHSAAKILDFTSPKKPSATVTSQTLSTPPRTSRGRPTLLVADTPTKEMHIDDCLTPTKGRGDMSLLHTPTKYQSTSAQGSTPNKRLAGIPTHKECLSTPKKRGRGQDVERSTKRMSSQGCSSPSSQHSSTMNYLSPTRRPTTSHPEPSTSITPIKTRRVLLSPAKTPTKSVLTNSPARDQQFLSPVKTTSKPILRNSPMRRSPSRQRGMSTTPQKSPRVSFKGHPGSSAHGEHEAKTPDSQYKWQRRKRQWSGDSSRSPPSSQSDHQGKIHDEQAHPAGIGNLLSWEDSKQDGSQGFAVAGPSRAATSRKRSSLFSETDSFSSFSHKRQKMDSSVTSGVSRPTLFSENAVDSYFSASSDDVFLGSSQPQPSLFVTEQSEGSRSSRPESPLFKGKIKQKGTVDDSENSRAFDFASKQSSFDSMAGSQGFQAVLSGAGDRGERSPSPTFNTSPALKKRSSVKRRRDQSQVGDAPVNDFIADAQNKLHPAVYQQMQKDISSPDKPGPSSEGRSSGSAKKSSSEKTPLRIKGVLVTYSPSVSTTSLAQLMNSPLLLLSPTDPQTMQNTEHQQARLAEQQAKQAEQQEAKQAEQEAKQTEQEDTVRSPRKKRSRKKLQI